MVLYLHTWCPNYSLLSFKLLLVLRILSSKIRHQIFYVVNIVIYFFESLSVFTMLATYTWQYFDWGRTGMDREHVRNKVTNLAVCTHGYTFLFFFFSFSSLLLITTNLATFFFVFSQRV